MRSYRPRINYGWAPGGFRPADMARFLAWVYSTYCWARGEVYYYAKLKPEMLQRTYEYWRSRYA